MGNVILNTGLCAKIQYCFEKLGIRVWSVEELCYYFRENTFLLDADVVSKRLVEWLATECELLELAEGLRPLLHHKNSQAVFVTTILQYTGYYGSEEINRISQALQSGAGLSEYERQKKRGDFLMENQKYTKALLEYENILKELPIQEKEIRAAILHNRGVAFAKLFLFERAAEQFLSAHELVQNEEYFKDYLAAKRMLYDDKDYVSFVAELPQAYELSLALEKEVDGILEEWENGDELQRLEFLRAMKDEGESTLYYEEMDMRVQALKAGYRDCTQA